MVDDVISPVCSEIGAQEQVGCFNEHGFGDYRVVPDVWVQLGVAIAGVVGPLQRGQDTAVIGGWPFLLQRHQCGEVIDDVRYLLHLFLCKPLVADHFGSFADGGLTAVLVLSGRGCLPLGIRHGCGHHCCEFLHIEVSGRFVAHE